MQRMQTLARIGALFLLWGSAAFFILMPPQLANAAPQATTRYVSPTGSNGTIAFGIPLLNFCTNAAKPCKTIKWAAETIAQNGDTIALSAGTFTETVTLAKNLTIRGKGTRKTIVDGALQGTVFTISQYVNVHLKKLRIQRGNGSSGGGISVAGGATLTAKNVTLIDNQANSGGGIASYGTLNLDQVVLYRNHGTNNSGGGLANNGTATLTRTDIELNDAQYGAAILNSSKLTITDSALHHNTTPNGYPGIYSNSGGTLSLTNVTISHNTTNATALQGGAISQVNGTATLNYVTITQNTQAHFGAIYASQGSVKISNSIIYDNGASPQCGSASIGVFSDGGYNVYADQSCSYWTGSGTLLANPKLKALNYNGGFTPTHALKASSPAIDLAPKNKCTAHDQREVARPLDGNGDGKVRCDAGAFEFQP